jgi:hypothetical protein
MPTVIPPLEICLVLLAACVIATAFIARQYIQIVYEARALVVHEFNEEFPNGTKDIPTADLLRAGFAGGFSLSAKVNWFAPAGGSEAYRRLVWRAQLFLWLGGLAVAGGIVCLALALQNFR